MTGLYQNTTHRRGHNSRLLSMPTTWLKALYALLAFLLSSLSISNAYATPHAVFEISDSGSHFKHECSTGYPLSYMIGRVKNDGDSDLVITGINITGRDAKNFAFDFFNPHDPKDVFHEIVIPAGASYDQEFGITPRCQGLGKVGQLEAQVVLSTNDPSNSTLTIPLSALANGRPNILMAGLRGSIVRVNGVKLLRLSFTIGNNSPFPTTIKPEVGVELAGKTRTFTAPSKMKGSESHTFRVLIPNIPRAATKVFLGLTYPTLASGRVQVDPRNRIFEGNEDRHGNLSDLESSDYEYRHFGLLER